MRTKRLAMWPKPPWCISLKAAKKISGLDYSFVVDNVIFFLGFWLIFCHFHIPSPIVPPATRPYEVFVNGVLANSGNYPNDSMDTPIVFPWFVFPAGISGVLS